MVDFTTMSYDELLRGGGHECGCGKVHATALKYLRIGSGVITLIPEALRTLGFQRPFVVCDVNTYAAAGERVVQILGEAAVAHTLFIIPGKHASPLEPDEFSVGSVAMAFDPACDVVLAVGSGVINDCCKVLAHVAKIPSIVVGTAPSMDGYASNSSSMVQNGLKVSLYNDCPIAVIADLDIMKDAPMRMLMAGLGDVLAKCVALCDWRIANAVVGEDYCEALAALMRHCVKQTLDNAKGLMRREPEAVKSVVEGLVLSGIAMSFAGGSRPASGLEHYFSHMWEMRDLQRGEPAELHGIQVGVGTCLCLSLYPRLNDITPDRAFALSKRAAFSQSEWEAQMRQIFGGVAPSIIEGERTQWHKNDAAGHQERLDVIIERWDDILRAVAEELPDAASTIAKLHALGMPTTPADLGLSREDTVDAFIGSREIRNKYLMSSLLWDIGRLDEFAEYLGDGL